MLSSPLVQPKLTDVANKGNLFRSLSSLISSTYSLTLKLFDQFGFYRKEEVDEKYLCLGSSKKKKNPEKYFKEEVHVHLDPYPLNS